MNRVAKAGFRADFVKSAVLPDWWSTSCASDTSLLPDVEFRIARFLGVSVEQLRQPEASLNPPVYPGARLRKVKNIDADRLAPAIHAGLRIGAAALRSLREPSTTVRLPPSDPLQWWSELNAAHAPADLGRQVADLWSRGIPVVHVEILPSPKYQALAGIIEGRPVIILGYGGDEPPRVGYHLIHEVGHVVRGHCAENQPVVDEEDDVEDSSDLEKEADAYAWSFVTGGRAVPKLQSDEFRKLASEASTASKKLGVDAGTIVWAWTVRTGQFPTGLMALKALYRGQGARRVLREQFDAHVDLEQASESDRALLRCVFGDPDRDALAG